jgi:hypothetical protein
MHCNTQDTTKHCIHRCEEKEYESHVCKSSVGVRAVVFSPDRSPKKVSVGCECDGMNLLTARAQLQSALCSVEVSLLAGRYISSEDHTSGLQPRRSACILTMRFQQAVEL